MLTSKILGFNYFKDIRMNKFSSYANSLILAALSASVSAIAFEAGAQEVDFYRVLTP